MTSAWRTRAAVALIGLHAALLTAGNLRASDATRALRQLAAPYLEWTGQRQGWRLYAAPMAVTRRFDVKIAGPGGEVVVAGTDMSARELHIGLGLDAGAKDAPRLRAFVAHVARRYGPGGSATRATIAWERAVITRGAGAQDLAYEADGEWMWTP